MAKSYVFIIRDVPMNNARLLTQVFGVLINPDFLVTSYVSLNIYYLNNFLFSIFHEEFLIHLFKKKTKIFDKYNLIMNH